MLPEPSWVVTVDIFIDHAFAKRPSFGRVDYYAVLAERLCWWIKLLSLRCTSGIPFVVVYRRCVRPRWVGRRSYRRLPDKFDISMLSGEAFLPFVCMCSTHFRIPVCFIMAVETTYYNNSRLRFSL